MRHLAIITTGGTIEKIYDEAAGVLENRRTIVDRMLRRLRLTDTTLSVLELMSKDSLLMTDADRVAIAHAVRDTLATTPRPAGVLILHGTDTLSHTGEHLHKTLSPLPVPVVLTGAMRPFDMRRSDALQNLTEALFATSTLPPGVYCVAHGRALVFPGVTKDRTRGTFHKPKD